MNDKRRTHTPLTISMPEQSKHILAKLLSALFHPLMMPVYLSLVLLFSKFAPSINPRLKWQILGIVAYSFVLLPVGILFFLKKFGKISSLHLEKQKERFLPMLLIAISYIVGIFLLHIHGAPNTLILLMRGVLLAILMVALISMVWKISAHTTALGGALGVILLLSVIYRTDLSAWAACISLLAGSIAWSRLYLKHHTIKQVNYGFMIGFSAMIISFLLHINTL